MEEKRSEVVPFGDDLLSLGGLYRFQVCHIAKHAQGSLQRRKEVWLPRPVKEGILLPLRTLLPGSLPLAPAAKRSRA